MKNDESLLQVALKTDFHGGANKMHGRATPTHPYLRARDKLPGNVNSTSIGRASKLSKSILAQINASVATAWTGVSGCDDDGLAVVIDLDALVAVVIHVLLWQGDDGA